MAKENIISNELREQMQTAYDWLQLTHDISIGYDGYRSSKGLMSLIDEMDAYVVEAMKCIKKGKIK